MEPSLADHQGPLTEALAEVGGLSFFGFVEPVEPARFPDLVANEADWITGAVSFRGGFTGVVRCAVPVDLARELVSSFSGDEASGDGALHDLMGEFTNMVCGTWLSRTCPAQVFNLGSPQVTRMPGGWTPAGAAGPAPVLAAFNDRPVAVWMAAE